MTGPATDGDALERGAIEEAAERLGDRFAIDFAVTYAPSMFSGNVKVGYKEVRERAQRELKRLREVEARSLRRSP